MIEIIFQKKQDAFNLYQHMISRLASWLETNSILLNEDQNRVLISGQLLYDNMLEEVKESFCEFITRMKRDEWFKGILEESYYFSNTEEQSEIMDIIYSVLEGDRKELAPFMEGAGDDALVEKVVDEIFNEKISFSFDSLVMFRLKPFIDKLSKWVEIAIDEYKMEQEYQVFVHTLRDFLAGRKQRMSHLYLVVDDHVAFYNHHFVEMKRNELFKAIDRKLLVNHPVYVDSGTIAPLLSIAPGTIYLYTDDPQQPLVRTILNIFEERVKVSMISAFGKEKTNFLNKDSENIR